MEQEKERLFSWNEVPGKDSERLRKWLRKFLKEAHGVSWVCTVDSFG